MLLNLHFANNTIISGFLFFSLIIYLYLLIPGVITQIFNATPEFAIPTGITNKGAKSKIETHSVTAET